MLTQMFTHMWDWFSLSLSYRAGNDGWCARHCAPSYKENLRHQFFGGIHSKAILIWLPWPPPPTTLIWSWREKNPTLSPDYSIFLECKFTTTTLYFWSLVASCCILSFMLYLANVTTPGIAIENYCLTSTGRRMLPTLLTSMLVTQASEFEEHFCPTHSLYHLKFVQRYILRGKCNSSDPDLFALNSSQCCFEEANVKKAFSSALSRAFLFKEKGKKRISVCWR